MFYRLHHILTVLCFCACAYGTCTPEAVKDGFNQCLANNHMGTYFQFPIVSASNYVNLCNNVTCLTYCMSQVAAPCTSNDFMVHIGNADELSAAYLGLCDQLETDVKATLTCGNSVSNQDALNAISIFQTSLEASYAASSENTTAICSEWITMKGTLDALITAACSGVGLDYWTKFLNTVGYECENSLSPSWYTDYRETSSNRCSGKDPLLQSVTIQLLMAVILFWKIS